jgi:hypothetical protein
LIVNRVALLADGEHDDPVATEAALRDDLGAALAAKVAASAADLQLLASRHAESIERLTAALDEPDPIVVPRLDGEVQDIDGLLLLYRHLAAAAQNDDDPGAECAPGPTKTYTGE